MQIAQYVGHLVDGAGELAGILDKAGDIAQPHAARQVHQRAEHADHGQRDVVDEVDRGADDGTVVFAGGVCVHGLVVLAVKVAQHLGLAAIGLGGLLAANHLLHKAVELPQLGAALAEHGAGAAGHPSGIQRGEGDGHGEDDHQRRLDGQHHNQRYADGDDAFQYHQKVGRQAFVDGVNVVAHHADEVARLPPVKETDRQGDQLVKHILAHAVGGVAGQFEGNAAQQVAEDGGGEVAHRHHAGVGKQQAEVGLPRADADGVNGQARQLGAHQRHQVGQYHQHHGQQQQEAIAAQVAPHAPQQLPAGRVHLVVLALVAA